MTGRRRVAAAVFAVLLVLAVAALAFVDFRAAVGDSTVQRSVSTGSLGDATADLSGTASLHVAGDDWLAERLRDRLAADLRDRGVAVERLDAPRADVDGPVLVVAVVDRDVAYNPVRPTAAVTWRFLYSATGNVSQFGRPRDDPSAGEFDGDLLVERLREDRLAPFRLGGEVRFVRDGTLSLEDRRTGVVSRPAYRRHLAAAMSEHTVDALVA